MYAARSRTTGEKAEPTIWDPRTSPLSQPWVVYKKKKEGAVNLLKWTIRSIRGDTRYQFSARPRRRGLLPGYYYVLVVYDLPAF